MCDRSWLRGRSRRNHRSRGCGHLRPGAVRQREPGAAVCRPRRRGCGRAGGDEGEAPAHYSAPERPQPDEQYATERIRQQYKTVSRFVQTYVGVPTVNSQQRTTGLNTARWAVPVGTVLAFAALVLVSTIALAQTVPVVTGDARVDKLLSQMTLEEKLTLIHGTHEDPAVYQGQAGYLAGIPRLGIPGLRFADGPPGVLTRHPSQGETATMGVAATFSVKLAEENGVVIGREDRALGIDVSLQPFVNIDRDLEFGRGYNTFGEDPFLTAEMGVAEIKGIQSQHVMAQIKHYVAYDSNSGNIFVDDQTLHEVYVAPFDAAIRKAGVSSIMCSYNRVNGTFACGNDSTLTKILRDEIGFKGFVTSDSA